MRAREINRKIEALGGTMTRQTGSHRRYQVTLNGQTFHATVPQHGTRDLPKGTLASIQRQLEPAFGKGWLTR